MHGLRLDRGEIRDVLEVKRDGIVITDTSIEADRSGILWRAGHWSPGSYQITYEHGMDETPARVSRACLELARRWLVESPWDERVTDYSSGEGDRFRLLTAGPDPFDIPEVNAVARLYGQPLVGS